MAKRCDLKMIQDKLRQKRLPWFGHVRRETEGGVLRLVEEMEVSEKKESRKIKENLERYKMRDLELIGVDESVALD